MTEIPGAEMLEAALGYGAGGRDWAVFPCRPRSKAPATEHGCKDARKGAWWLKRLWAEAPGANPALACGEESGVWVLDIDVKDGKPGYETLATLESLFGPLPTTLTQKTPSGGEQRVFRWPGRKVINSVEKRLGPGLDTRGDGGYVVLPPAIHPDFLDGPRYAWVDAAAEVAEAPDWLLRLLDGGNEDLELLRARLAGREAEAPEWLAKRLRLAQPKAGKAAAQPRVTDRISPYARAALDAECAEVRRTLPGGQNNVLNTAAFNLGGFIESGVLPEALVVQHLTVAAMAWSYDPRKGPWSAEQIKRRIADGIAAGRQHRRDVPEPTRALPTGIGAGRGRAEGRGGFAGRATAPVASPELLDAARALWAMRQPIAGTPAAAFLRGLGGDGSRDWPMLGFIPSLEITMPTGVDGRAESLGMAPALVAAMGRWLDGRPPALSAVYVVHLDQQGAALMVPDPRSGRQAVARRLVGAWGGAAIRLTPLFAPRLALATGLRDGLGLAARRDDLPVWVAGTLGALHRVALPETVTEVLVIGAGRTDLEQERAIAQALRGRGRAVRIVRPSRADGERRRAG